MNAGRVLKRSAVQTAETRRLVSAPVAPDEQSEAGLTATATSEFTPTVDVQVAVPDPAVALQAELDALRRTAAEEGRQEGLAMAREAAEKASKDLRASQRKFMHTLDEAFRQWRTEQEELVADIAFAAVCRLVGEAHADKTTALAAVKQVLAQLQPDSVVTIQLHPGDVALLEDGLLDSPGISFEQLKIEASAKVELGGCRIVAADGVFDARLETQLGFLRERLNLARAAWRNQPR